MRFSRDQLSAMSISRLRAIDIMDGEEEKLVQEILDAKIMANPTVGTSVDVNLKAIYHNIPDITTPEEEAKWQKVVDERKAMYAPKQKETQPETQPETQIEDAKENFCEKCQKQVKTSPAFKRHNLKYHKDTV